MYVILDGQWWAGAVTRVMTRARGHSKVELRLFGAKKNTPCVVVNLTTAHYRLRQPPSQGGFFAIGAPLAVLDQFISKKTKRWVGGWVHPSRIELSWVLTLAFAFAFGFDFDFCCGHMDVAINSKS